MPDSGNAPLVWMLALLAGGALGAVFFAGLWWTVRLGASSVTPARWFIASLVLRTAVVLSGFHLVGAGQPERMGLCLLGFLLARTIALRVTRKTAGETRPPCA